MNEIILASIYELFLNWKKLIYIFYQRVILRKIKIIPNDDYLVVFYVFVNEESRASFK